jgi:hypothetical protein
MTLDRILVERKLYENDEKESQEEANKMIAHAKKYGLSLKKIRKNKDAIWSIFMD